MKTRSSLLAMVSLLAITLIIAGCGGASTTTTKTTATGTTNTTTTTTTNTSTTKTTTTSSAALPGTAIKITTHNAAQLTGYKGLCLMCHGTGTTNSFPTAPSWDGAKNGSTANPGTYTVAAGSDADHTGRTADDCTKAGCHTS